MSEELVTNSDEQEQMQLTLEGEQLYIDRDELPFRYTGERFKRDYPERYKAAVDLLASGQFSHRSIAKFVHADYRTIYQVALTSIKEQEERRAVLSEKFFVQMMVLGDKTLELVDKCQKPSDSAIPMGIAKDCYLQVGGLPTAHVEVNHRFDFGAELARLHKEAEERIKQVLGHVIEPAQLENGGSANESDRSCG
jgi:hypothetical protein